MSAKESILHYCYYQERCHKEVRNKLYEMGCRKDEVEELISEMIQADVLNEERYAKAIAGGKFRMNKWGKKKILYLLQQNQISDYCIKKGLAEIDDHEYYTTILNLIEKKLPDYKSKSQYITKNKLIKYLLGKGYEYNLIQQAINETLN